MASASVVESSRTTTTKVTKTTTTRRSSERSAAASRTSTSRSRSTSRSPSRRKALNRSPSPHRYPTRRSQVSADETESKSQGCAITACLSGCCTKLRTCVNKTKGLLKDIATCGVYLAISYVALTMCSYGKCGIRLPVVPSLSVLYNEAVFVQTILSFLLAFVYFSIPLGQEVKGVPTDRGTLNYLCNAPAALLSALAVHLAVYKLDPSLTDITGKELQMLFGGVVCILIIAVCIQWKFACFGLIYSVVATIGLAYLAERRFNITGQPASHFSTAVLVFAIGLNSYALSRTMFKGLNNSTIKAASRGLLIQAATWTLAHKNYTLPEKSCFLNTAAIVSLVAIIVTQLFFIYQHKQCAKASSLIILLVAAVAGVLVQQKYLVIPSKLPLNSLWYCFNIGSALDSVFVLARGNWKTNFFGFKPVDFVTKVFKGDYDPRFGTFDLKFFSIRIGFIGPLFYCVTIGLQRYEAGTLSCAVSTILAMTMLYSATKLICLEKAMTSQTEIVEQRCGVGFMLWSMTVQPQLTILPLRYILSMPVNTSPHACCYTSIALGISFVVGLATHAIATLQGHYLLTGENHSVVQGLTTLKANGDEKIPVSGIWKFMRYPFITGELMVLASLALSTGFEGVLVYLPLAICLVRSLFLIHTYNKISPSFYGHRAWKEYQQMVRFNIIPGVW